MTKRNYQKIGESLPKEWEITEFWFEGVQVVLTSKGLWVPVESPEEYRH